MLTSLKFGFWLNVMFSAMNLASFFAYGSLLALVVAGFNAYVAYSLRQYA